jgi:hypothetical protein
MKRILAAVAATSVLLVAPPTAAQAAPVQIAVTESVVLPVISNHRPAVKQDKQLTLPKPTGPQRVGTVSLHLVDKSRPDPWVSAESARELMV